MSRTRFCGPMSSAELAEGRVIRVSRGGTSISLAAGRVRFVSSRKPGDRTPRAESQTPQRAKGTPEGLRISSLFIQQVFVEGYVPGLL